MSERELHAAVAAGALAGEEAQRALLRSIVQVARAIFRARASSIVLFVEETEELVFEAVVGEGEDTLVGSRFPADRGISGWVFSTGQPLVIEDVGKDPRFARDVAESSGYVPRGLMVYPLLHEGEVLGVLSVLDRPADAKFSLAEMELLGLFAGQAAIALDVVRSTRRAHSALAGGDEGARELGRVAALLEALPEERRAAGTRLLAALADVLDAGS